MLQQDNHMERQRTDGGCTMQLGLPVGKVAQVSALCSAILRTQSEASGD
jgi:hypothetical protein